MNYKKMINVVLWVLILGCLGLCVAAVVTGNIYYSVFALLANLSAAYIQIKQEYRCPTNTKY